MAVEKVSAGPAMQRPQPAPSEVRPRDVGAELEGQAPVGAAPSFDRATGTLITPKAGMLANPVVQQYTSAEPPTAERPEMEKVDVGSITIEEKKKPAEKRSSQKKRQKQDQQPR